MTSLDIMECHSSEIRDLCLIKWPGKTLQNLPYECPGLCEQRPVHSLEEKKVAQNEKQLCIWAFIEITQQNASKFAIYFT